MDRLERAGLAQYEISNVARPGRESRHNLKYWTDGEWVGFGCGAHSTVGGVRWKTVASTTAYIDRVMSGTDLVTESRVLSSLERLEEALFTGLRLTKGIDLTAISNRYEFDAWARYGEALRPFLDSGRLVRDSAWLRLTREGMLTANDVMAVFV
jgi:oxygen-independent coproporphyrinogen-3 oxidase